MENDEIVYLDYTDESMISEIQSLVAKDLSEPYSVFTYRYFLQAWPSLCICAFHQNIMVGTILCKAEEESDCHRGYIAMLAVNSSFRKRGIGYKLVTVALERMIAVGCYEISLEAEASNTAALMLYEKLGFLRDEKLIRYYLNGGDAFRLKLWVDKGLKSESNIEETSELKQQQSIVVVGNKVI